MATSCDSAIQAADLRILVPSQSTDTMGTDSLLARFTPWHDVVDSNAFVAAAIKADPRAAKAVGSIVGMAIGDAIGHPLEFIPVQDHPTPDGPGFSLEQLCYRQELNSFLLKPGQWTDDTSMGLCVADSLLRSAQLKCGFDGVDLRCRFHAWWYHGYNNCFGYDHDHGGGKVRQSVGLGGNIGKSLRAITVGEFPPAIYEAKNNDSGNGSLMRLAAVPCMYWRNPSEARRVAAATSYTTHPGPIAAWACEFTAFVIASAIASPMRDSGQITAADFISDAAERFLDLTQHLNDSSGLDEVRRLLKSAELDSSAERCWNWKADCLEIRATLARRGPKYNGYPVSPGYFGAYSIDGLALALHCIYHTQSFGDAIERCVNFCGDADSTASIVGQIAGALYGINAIDTRLLDNLRQWDPHGHIPLRGALLFFAADDASFESKSSPSSETERIKKNKHADAMQELLATGRAWEVANASRPPASARRPWWKFW